MPRFEYIDDLPGLSSELVDAVWYCVGNHPNISPPEQTQGRYEIYHANKPLTQFVEQTFGQEFVCRIQVIKEGILIHKDVGRTTAHNFIIDCGGEHAATCYYNDQLELIEQIEIQAQRWHKLDLTVYHNVIDLDHNRVALTVFIAEDRNNFKPLNLGVAPSH